jgi:hypothetical protein
MLVQLKRQKEEASKYEISVNDIEKITEILIANYNETMHGGINNFKPLELMQQRINRGLIPRIMSFEKQKEVVFLSLTVKRQISCLVTQKLFLIFSEVIIMVNIGYNLCLQSFKLYK